MQLLEVFSLVSILVSAPLDCQGFMNAASSFKRLCGLRDPSDDQCRTIVVFRAALNARFAAGRITLRELAGAIGTCGTFRLFLDEIALGDNDTVIGSSTGVNIFSTSHIANCAQCRFVFAMENYRKAVEAARRIHNPSPRP
jgi:hypothetical protein